MEKRILSLLKEYQPLSEKQLRGFLICAPDELKNALGALVQRGQIIVTRRGKYKLADKDEKLVTGKLVIKRGGFGFVLREGGDIFIGEKHLMGALPGEQVMARLCGMHGQHEAGQVVRIISQMPYVFTGQIGQSRSGLCVRADDPLVGVVAIPRKAAMGARPGQLVAGEITQREVNGRPLTGCVTEILGNRGDAGVDILAAARGFGLRAEFPGAVEKQAQHAAEQLPVLDDRQTLFDKKIFTIDGVDAKDLDDAVSIECLPNGNLRLGVHIADVSEYVEEGTALDKEALGRGTSVYLIDRVIPMLPVCLSNGVCSLSEGETRLTLSCFMEFDEKARIVTQEIAKTAIRSSHRMTYDDVNAMICGNQEMCDKYADILPDVKAMAELAKRLQRKRKQAGGLDLDIPEPVIELDESGRAVDIHVRERGAAERMIEAFMLAANETVAEVYTDYPFVYRIHEQPDIEKMRELSIFLSSFGYMLRTKPTSGQIADILDKCADTDSASIIKQVVLRSLKKAKYSPSDEGHFGLASQSYCHFTSPIRRYPDLQIHRIITDILAGRMTKGRAEHYDGILGAVAAASSERERAAMEAERRVEDIKKAEYMRSFIDEEFDAVISGASAGAIFAELENTVEGVIPLSAMKDDYYVFRKELYCVIGEHTHRKVSLGDKVRVIVREADPDAGRVEFGITKYL